MNNKFAIMATRFFKRKSEFYTFLSENSPGRSPACNWGAKHAKHLAEGAKRAQGWLQGWLHFASFGPLPLHPIPGRRAAQKA
jgi:hypothetical protein